MVRGGESTDSINIEKLQDTLMADDCFLPEKQRRVSSLSKNLYCNSETVRNGKDRGDENKWVGKKGDFLEYRSDKPFALSGIRLVFDSDLNRDYQNMPCCIKLNEDRFKLPKTLIKDFDIILDYEDGREETLNYRNIHTRLLNISINRSVVGVKFLPISTYGSETFNVFDFEVV